MTPETARAFAESWQRAWNRHDLEAVLAHFTDDVVFTSPVAAQLLPDTGGRLVGKQALRDYWRLGLERIPGLHFEVLDVYTGIDVVVVNYRNHVGGVVNEVLHLDEQGLVARGEGTYLAADAAAASGA